MTNLNINKTLTLTCSITGNLCPFGQYADCNVCSIDTTLNEYNGYEEAFDCKYDYDPKEDMPYVQEECYDDYDSRDNSEFK